MSNLNIPVYATWDSVIIRFITADTVDIRAGGRPIGVKHYEELGFAGKKTGESDPLWGQLKYLAKVNGEVSSDELAAEDGACFKKNISRLRARLKTGFGIVNDPFLPYYKSESFRTRFIISGTPSA
jgi:hypothetical protein